MYRDPLAGPIGRCCSFSPEPTKRVAPPDVERTECPGEDLSRAGRVCAHDDPDGCLGQINARVKALDVGVRPGRVRAVVDADEKTLREVQGRYAR